MAGKRKKKHIFLKIFIGFSIFIFSCIAAVFGILYATGIGPQVMTLYNEAQAVAKMSNTDTFKASQTTLIYSSDGSEMAKLKGEKGIYYIETEAIPTYVKNAFISIEDKKFYSHNGIDIKAIIRSAKSIIENQAITQGGSTITQQLSRTMFLSTTKSWQRKVKEIFIALELEKKYTKAQILEFYVNNIYFSNGYYGIQAASMGYFNTDIKNLSLSQTAFLCAIPNNPTLYDPLEHIDNTISRRNRILNQMLEDKKIGQSEYNEAINEEIVLNPAPKEAIKNNYAQTYIYHCATRALMQAQGFNFKYYFNSEAEKEKYNEEYASLYGECQSSLYTSGYRIYTSIDLEKQKQLQAAIDDNLYGFVSVNEEGIYNMQSAATCIDNISGNVVAIIGGRSQDLSGYTLNRAYQSYRQPGSAIKLLIVYTPAFENGYTPDSMLVDEPIEDGPTNYGGGYMGNVSLRTAVEKSINTVAWKLLEQITPKVGLEYLKNMNFANIEADDYRNASALGGFTTGVSTVEMASAYAAINDGGRYREPTCIRKITDASGNVIYKNEAETKQIYKETAANMMTDVLKGVMTQGTGRKLQIDGITTAGKSGTTNDNKDGWFVGFSYYYTTAVWTGCDMPKEVEDLTGSSYPGRIWQQFMKNAHEGLTDIDLSNYVNYESVEKYPKYDIDTIDEDVTDDIINEEDIENEAAEEEMPSEDEGVVE